MKPTLPALLVFAVLTLSFSLPVTANPGNGQGSGNQGESGQHGHDDNSTADGGGHGGGHGKGRECRTDHDGHPQHPDPQGNGTSQQAVHLSGDGSNGTNTFHWEVTGTDSEPCAFNVYRSDDGGNSQLIGTIEGTARSFTDPNAPMGTVIYDVQAIRPDGSSGARSNSQVITAAPCTIVSFDPFVPPYVVIHTQCLPAGGNIFRVG